MGSEMPDQVAKEFCFVANGIHGLYLDTASAIGNLAASCIDHHKKYLDQASASGQPAAARDAPNPIVVYTTQAGGEARPVHHTTLVDLIKRNQPKYNKQGK